MQSQSTHTPYSDVDAEEPEFSFRNLVQQWMNTIRHILIRHLRVVLVISILGALLGLGYAWIKSPTYTARLSFVVEESKSSGGSIASALAGQFGFDIGGMSGTSGILAGDNVLELLKSRSLIKKTLLTSYRDSSAVSLADRYADVYRWKEKWAGNAAIGKQVNFTANATKFSRLEDSLLQVITKRIVEKELSIAKPDKKLGFFELQVTTKNEEISKLFCERLLKIATDFYIDTKTKRLRNNVARLQKRADSLEAVLDKRTFSAAEANQLLLDANPAYAAPTVGAEISSRNKFIQSTVYAEIVKNLEVSKTSLIQETPTVQVVDSPDLPLQENKVKWYLAPLIGALVGFGGTVLLLFLGEGNSKIKS
ncbi:MAG: hypothetical protein HYU71_08830 [Bacteroidetes bacterium]|nr:hypothetical protein [Bacteroidota bacterium]